MTSDSAIDSRIQVLLIDDDAHLRQALSQTLDLAGLKVLSLGDAQGVTPLAPAAQRGQHANARILRRAGTRA